MCFSKPSVPAVQPPPQAPKAPEVQALYRANKRGVTGGVGASPTSTLLAGTSGIKDSELLLGKTSLLGG